MRSTQPLCLTNITPCCVMWRHHHLLLAVLNTSVLRLCLTNITHRCCVTSSPFYNSPTWKYQPYAFVLKTSPFVINITSCYVCECRRYLLLLINWKHRSPHRFKFLFDKLILPALFAIVVLRACVTLLLLAVLETLSITNRTYPIVWQSIPTSVWHCCVTYPSDVIAFYNSPFWKHPSSPLFYKHRPALFSFVVLCIYDCRQTAHVMRCSSLYTTNPATLSDIDLLCRWWWMIL